LILIGSEQIGSRTNSNRIGTSNSDWISTAENFTPLGRTNTGVLALMPPAATSPVEQTQQIDLKKKLRREKPDESDTKMIRINVIRMGFGPIFHGDR
jgi:hypothetical protein